MTAREENDGEKARGTTQKQQERGRKEFYLFLHALRRKLFRS
jgi:hypothetical protein